MSGYLKKGKLTIIPLKCPLKIRGRGKVKI
jgi:hypothetical protein